MLGLALTLLLQAETISPADFEKHIATLAADDMKGRDNDTDEGRKAAQYVADRFKDFGLKPGGKEGYFHDFTTRLSEGGAKTFTGRNVIGLLEGENAKEYVVVAAHHDARGVIGGKIQNGADDNASGVAMVLELAQAFTAAKPKRSILFVSFDCEEDGLLGSREFVTSKLYAPESFVAMFVFDLIGGESFEWERNRIYALGCEYSAELHERVGKCAAEIKDLEVARAGVYLIEPFPGGARSDYSAFRRHGVPFVFFSTGTPWYYHTEHDDVGVINFGKMAKAGMFAYRVIGETVSQADRPKFRNPVPHEDDVRAMKEHLSKIVESREKLKLSEKQIEAARGLLAEVSSLKQPDARVLQRAMIFVFSVARAQGRK